MCRIAGIINPSAANEAIAAMVVDMCNTLKNGGPDDEGFYTDELAHLTFGHRRLSIIDLTSSGHQPMQYMQGRYTITYNGELYNYLDLKKQLTILNCTFLTQTDTEVIIAAFATWGELAFNKLQGMFAFAIWDKQAQQLYLVRDATGIKPLYYAYSASNGLAFASEVKALQKIPYLNIPNPNWQIYFMAYGHLPEPITTLKNVQPLTKGNFLKYNAVSNSVTIHTYKQFYFIEKLQNRNEVIQKLYASLNNAVSSHLVSDAPIGVFLSGGLDSSIIALLANKHHKKINTSSIYFENEIYSEQKYQNQILETLNCAHTQHLLTENDFHQYLPNIIEAMDLPSCDGINSWFISRYAKLAGLKAVLSGIGGDELFGGYPSFNRINITNALQHLPANVLNFSKFTNNKHFKRLAYLSIPGAVGKYLFLRGQFVPNEIAQHLNANEKEVWNTLKNIPNVPNIEHLSAKNQVSWMETNLYMQNQLLRDADVMSMAHGIEIRMPFLDINFVAFAFQIASASKYVGGKGKQLLIDTFKNELPASIWNRAKMGFTFPFKEWLIHQQYSSANNGSKIKIAHQKLVNNSLHWSQFLTIYLMENKKFNDK
jgi:asparagine synthase (glutamine-hydrolysing)